MCIPINIVNMKCNVLIVCVGDRDISFYTRLFREYAHIKGEKLFVSIDTQSYNERCSRAYSFKLGGVGDIVEGEADLVIALEQLEGVRYRCYGKEEASMIISTYRDIPVSVFFAGKAYPNDCFQKCINDCFSVFKVEEHIGDEYIGALGLRLLGEDIEQIGQIYSELNITLDLNKVFSQKSVKA